MIFKFIAFAYYNYPIFVKIFVTKQGVNINDY